MTNLFMTRASLSAEDRFTSHWCSLLTLVPDLGQLVTNRIAQLTMSPKAQFETIIDHPAVTTLDRPDCLLRTDKWEILFEHKLASPLGLKQLERYLAHTGPRTHLALVASQRMDLPRTVIEAERYLAPASDSARHHFLWSDFYPVIAKHPSPLANQFRAYMDSLGMNPLEWAGSGGDPFVEPSAAVAFLGLYEPLVQALATRGVRCVRRRNSLGLQIRRPHPRVPLFYVTPTHWDGLLEIPLVGRLLSMTTWVEGGERRTLPLQNGFVPGPGPRMFVDTYSEPSPAHWRDRLRAERNYYVPLDQVLIGQAEESATLLKQVVERALLHLRQGKNAKTQAPDYA